MNLELVDAELLKALEVSPELDIWADIDRARSEANAWLEQQPKVNIDGRIHIEDQWIQGSPGSFNLRVRVYRPVNVTERLPALLWVHGGGYVMGCPEGSDRFLVELLTSVPCVVISVDYRLAPEHPFPVPLEDCYTALKWLASNADQLNLDQRCIAIGGASAGGGLAAALAVLARDRGEVSVTFQMLLCPMLDDRNVTPSSYRIMDPRVWSRKDNLRAWAAYLGRSGDTSVMVKYTAAARIKNLENLPPTYIAVGSLDLFVDENINYAQRLNQADVPVELHIFPGGYHAFEFDVSDAQLAKQAIALHFNAVKQAFARLELTSGNK